MNFKPTLWKTILSLGAYLIGVLYIIYGIVMSPCTENTCSVVQFMIKVELAFYFALPIFLTSAVVIYIIWSLIQKKK